LRAEAAKNLRKSYKNEKTVSNMQKNEQKS